MKKCPFCNRTFADEFSFCLEDGSLLSAPFNLREEQETFIRPVEMKLPPTQAFSSKVSERNEIPTIVSAKNVNPIYPQSSERQNSQNSTAKSLGLLMGKANRKFSLRNFLIIIFISILAALYTFSVLPLIFGFLIAMIYIALSFALKSARK